MLGLALLIAGCAAPASPEFRQAYEAARSALESGDLATADALYDQLIASPEGDRYAARLHLEQAHLLLRAGDFDGAHAAALEAVSQSSDPAIAGQARLLAAIAEQASVSRAIGNGAGYGSIIERARAAYETLRRVSSEEARFDPEGVSVARLRLLREQIAGLEIAELKADRAAGATARADARAAYIRDRFADTRAVAEAGAVLAR